MHSVSQTWQWDFPRFYRTSICHNIYRLMWNGYLFHGVFQTHSSNTCVSGETFDPTFPVAGQSNVCFRLNLPFSFQLKPTTVSWVSGLFFFGLWQLHLLSQGPMPWWFWGPRSHIESPWWLIDETAYVGDQQKMVVFDMNAGCDKMRYSRW